MTSRTKKSKGFFSILLVALLCLSLVSPSGSQQVGPGPDGAGGYTAPGFYLPPGQSPYLGAPAYTGAPSHTSNPQPYPLGPTNQPYLGSMIPNQAQQSAPIWPGYQQNPTGLRQGALRFCGAGPPQQMLTPPAPGSYQTPSATVPVMAGQPGMAGQLSGDGVQQALRSAANELGQVMGRVPGTEGANQSLRSAVEELNRFIGQSSTMQRGQQGVNRGGKDSLKPQEPGLRDAVSPMFFQPEPFSPIEASFNQAVFPGQTFQELRQYGYSLFANPISTFAPVEDIPVGPDYILGPGDDMVIRIWGPMENSFVQTVDRNGQISLPSVGPVRVWGLTFKDAGQLIGQQLSRYYRGLQTSVTMGRLRTIRVYVVGEVCQPGSYTLSSLSTVTNALFAAGGPVKLGSLRNVQLKRNHHNVGTIDLYDFLLRGDKTRDFRLESGDTIFVPPIGPIAALTGEVKRPGIYEIQDSTRVSDFIEMAGGGTPQSYLKRVQILRTKPNAERVVIDLDLTTPHTNGESPVDVEIRNGDLVRIYATDPRIYNTVTLMGAVKHPGEYQLKTGMRLSQLIVPESTLPEAYLDRVEIARLKEGLTTEVIPVNLKQAWKSDQNQDIILQPRDHITIRSEYRNPWRVTLGGEVKRPGTYTINQGERLSSVLKRAGGFTDKAYPKGAVFIRESVRQVEKEKLDQFLRTQQERILAETTNITGGIGSVAREEASAQQSVLTQRFDQLQLVASKITLGRVVIQLSEVEKLEGSQNDLLLEDGDSLNIPVKPASVMVVGSVRNPTSVLYREGEDVQYYVNRAGGLSAGAATSDMYVVKADGSAITGFLRLRNVDPGDVLVVPPSVETKTQWIAVLKDFMAIAGQAAVGIAGIAGIIALH